MALTATIALFSDSSDRNAMVGSVYMVAPENKSMAFNGHGWYVTYTSGADLTADCTTGLGSALFYHRGLCHVTNNCCL